MINLNIPINGNYIDQYGNQIFAPSGLKNATVIFKGKNNKVFLRQNSLIANCKIEFASDNGFFSIGSSTGNFNANIRIGHSCRVVIGNQCTTTNNLHLTCAEGTWVNIGDDCMFASGNQIRTDDAHAIYSSITGARENHSKDIYIGNHVWVAYNAVIMGGSEIGDGSIVGFGSFVKKRFPNNCLIAGTPAKKIKDNIAWERPNLVPFTPEKSNKKVVLPVKYFEPTTQLDEISRNREHILKLDNILIQEKTLFIEGTLLLKGIPCPNYTDLDYVIYFDNEQHSIQYSLAKGNSKELNIIYGGGTTDYSKCYFTTTKFEGLNISSLPHSKYKISISIQTKNAYKKVPLEKGLEFIEKNNTWNVI